MAVSVGTREIHSLDDLLEGAGDTGLAREKRGELVVPIGVGDQGDTQGGLDALDIELRGPGEPLDRLQEGFGAGLTTFVPPRRMPMVSEQVPNTVGVNTRTMRSLLSPSQRP